ncbi:BZ3500_MvSof-1268-A1-R1_C097g00533 [Microbotryum saponariae]|uniref:BZ3500_MvSof-1268-A1-R1_C097g00533 protein n=1 Tax=Microbotryum saponariae TaxID=289078 RepID=A0A2X0LXD5_9BASI|nr:BZ3500_MvSof-1268-A1-R1_Chr10-1g02779 [Microbotryum saponariae]SDA01552.1 BZ3500_MvSof-1268-A1-R1_Chr10-2g02782 [Microbotryum saponariae]SDA04083.1 BZ3500_MvSof-1268-A1-R1_C097g00533 [Microbotryum saponariae]
MSTPAANLGDFLRVLMAVQAVLLTERVISGLEQRYGVKRLGPAECEESTLRSAQDLGARSEPGADLGARSEPGAPAQDLGARSEPGT